MVALGDICRVLITFANSLDPDQSRQNVGPDRSGSQPFGNLLVSLNDFLKIDFEKKLADDDKNMKKYPACKELKKAHVEIMYMRWMSNELIYSHCKIKTLAINQCLGSCLIVLKPCTCVA